MLDDDIKQKVRERYARAALDVREESEGGGSCCGGGTACCEAASSEVFEVDMVRGAYSEAEKGELPVLAAEASLGCGNPVALATLSPGETVLDLGSGGGIDVLLSETGFEEFAVEATHMYPAEQVEDLTQEEAEALRAVPVASAFIRARKPEGR